MEVTVANSERSEILEHLAHRLPHIEARNNSTRCRTLWTERAQRFLVCYAIEVSQVLSKALGSHLTAMSDNSDRGEKSSGVTVLLKAYGEPLQLTLPVELAQEITSSVLEEETSRIISQPGEDRLAVLAFFTARLLAESELFRAQRVYVVEVRGPEDESGHRRPHTLPSLIRIKLSYRNGDYVVQVNCSQNLIRRLQCYAELRPDANRTLRILRDAQISAQLALSAPTNSLLQVISLKPGSILPLPHKLLRGTLSWTTPNRQGSVRYPLKLADCDPQRLQFEIVRKE